MWTSVWLIYAKTELHVRILLEVIAVIALLDTLEATVKQVLKNSIFAFVT